MIHPDRQFKLNANTAILTFASIEQSGDQYEDFVNYLLENQTALCVHVEPMAELYDKNVLTDYLTYRFHTNRNYPKGFIDLLHKLETDGYIEILKIKRCYFGGWNHETFNMLIWKPTGKFKR